LQWIGDWDGRSSAGALICLKMRSPRKGEDHDSREAVVHAGDHLNQPLPAFDRSRHLPQGLPMPSLQLEAGSLHYKVTGHGVPLVLIGGLGMPLQAWAMQAQTLSRSFQLIRLDNRGCGASTLPSQSVSIQDMAADVVALLDHLQLKDAHVLGLSMGGFIALALAHMAPQRTRSLTLAHACAKLPVRTRLRLRLWQDMRQANIPPALMAREQLLWIFPENMLQNDGVVERLTAGLAQAIGSQSAEGFSSQVAACEQFDMLEALPGIAAPTLVIAAEDDLSAPPSHVEQLKNLSNVQKFKLFSSAGHVSHLVRAEEFNQELSEFVQSVDAANCPFGS
jgi:3-oxoadipate enol-lactonase